MTTLYLIPSERAAYEKLPAKIKKAWGGEVKDETGTPSKMEEQPGKRLQAIQDLMPAKLRLAVQKTMITAKKNGFDVGDFPKEIFPYVLLSLGAYGLTAVIDQVLNSAASADDLLIIQNLSSVRHSILVPKY